MLLKSRAGYSVLTQYPSQYSELKYFETSLQQVNVNKMEDNENILFHR